MDWRQSGDLLRQQWLELQSQFRRQVLKSLAIHLETLEREQPLLFAIMLDNRGDPSRLNDYLRSGQWGPDDGDVLAQWRRGELKAKSKSGRRKGKPREVAAFAERFYREWRDLNKRLGVKDHGHCVAMKDEAARFIVEELLPHINVNQATVREKFELPKNRRN